VNVEGDSEYRQLSEALGKAREEEQAAETKARTVKETFDRANPIMKKRLESGVREAEAALSRASTAAAQASQMVEQRRKGLMSGPS